MHISIKISLNSKNWNLQNNYVATVQKILSKTDSLALGVGETRDQGEPAVMVTPGAVNCVSC